MNKNELMSRAREFAPKYGPELERFVGQAYAKFPRKLRPYLRVRVWGGGLSGHPTVAVGIDRDVVGPVGVEIRMQSPTAPLYWFARSHAAAVAHEWQAISAITTKEHIKYLKNKASRR